MSCSSFQAVDRMFQIALQRILVSLGTDYFLEHGSDGQLVVGLEMGLRYNWGLLFDVWYNKYNYMKQSPNKREPVRKQRREWMGTKQYIRQFPLDIPEEVTNLLNLFQSIHTSFQQNLDNLKIYKAILGSQIEANWLDFMEFMKTIVIRMHKKMQKSLLDKNNQITQLININSKYQYQKQVLKDKIETLEHLKQLESAELQMANQQLKTSSNEIKDIYATLQNDMTKITNYLAHLEQSRANNDEKGSNQIYSSLEGLSTLMNSLDKEKKQTDSNLFTMRELIKTMARSSKATTATQVQQSQLQTKAVNVFLKHQDNKIPFDMEEAGGVNIPEEEHEHLIDKLKVKQRQTSPEVYKPQHNVDKPWALTPSLLVFLENMSKENQGGRVVPYQYVKQVISEIYHDRMELQQQMIQGQVGNAMMFDEFVIHYFLKKYRIRRLAEVKLLEFIISLKYYSKFWLKVQTFCYLIDTMRYQPSFEPSQTSTYKCDYYLQNFFFTVYKIMSSYETITEQDGTVFVEVRKVKKLMKALIFFTDDISRSRLGVKMDKQVRVFQKIDHVDFDFAMVLFIDEYFAVRRRCDSNIVKHFTKVYQRVEGYLSLDEMLQMFTSMEPIFKAGSNLSYKYPIDSQLHVSKLYLYSITSFKNNYQINGNSFLQACHRYGFNSPFPFIHQCKKKDKKDDISKNQSIVSNQPTVYKNQNSTKLIHNNSLIQKIESEAQKIANRKSALNNQRIDITSKLFSQHFSILKELKDYCEIFKLSLTKEKDPQTLWKSFNQITLIIQKGCQFLKYPLLTK